LEEGETICKTSGVMRRENAKLYPRRPGERRDPYAAAVMIEHNGRRLLSNKR
jgi:hypothetical protein